MDSAKFPHKKFLPFVSFQKKKTLAFRNWKTMNNGKVSTRKHLYQEIAKRNAFANRNFGWYANLCVREMTLRKVVRKKINMKAMSGYGRRVANAKRLNA